MAFRKKIISEWQIRFKKRKNQAIFPPIWGTMYHIHAWIRPKSCDLSPPFPLKPPALPGPDIINLLSFLYILYLQLKAQPKICPVSLKVPKQVPDLRRLPQLQTASRPVQCHIKEGALPLIHPPLFIQIYWSNLKYLKKIRKTLNNSYIFFGVPPLFFKIKLNF